MARAIPPTQTPNVCPRTASLLSRLQALNEPADHPPNNPEPPQRKASDSCTRPEKAKRRSIEAKNQRLSTCYLGGVHVCPRLDVLSRGASMYALVLWSKSRVSWLSCPGCLSSGCLSRVLAVFPGCPFGCLVLAVLVVFLLSARCPDLSRPDPRKKIQ